jgi:hypothetical protein
MSPCGDYERYVPDHWCVHWGCQVRVDYDERYCRVHRWDWDYGYCLSCRHWLGREPKAMKCPKCSREIAGTSPRTHRDRTDRETNPESWYVPFDASCLLCRENRDRPEVRSGLKQHYHGTYAFLPPPQGSESGGGEA